MPTPKKKAASTKVNLVKPASKKTKEVPQISHKINSHKIKSGNFLVRFFSGEQWMNVFKNSLQCWPYIIGRYILVLGLVIGFQFMGVVLLSGVFFAVFGGTTGLENVLANLQVGTLPSPNIMLISIGAFGVWLLYALIVGILGKVAFLSLVKDFVNQQKQRVSVLFFRIGFSFLWRYLGLSLKVFFHILWPILFLLGLFLVWDLVLFLYPNTAIFIAFTATYIPYAFAALFFAALFYVFYMMIKLLFTMPALIHSDKKIGETFALSKSITRGAWWFTALMWGLFVVLLYALNIEISYFGKLDPFILIDAVRPEDIISLTDLLAFLLSLFIFGPISTAFQYLLMLQIAQNQSVKL